ncbi:immunity 49 family protein [Amycolatopsis sp. DG1A-15b]|uniref:immunity 49 family protein n=1 Tax=Amycolatopsis sp. DG1A-15b TaxID=3052846 RepID=UPI00255C14E9|nr:immunity 49 family protein [Amycolatopsis sp. DG1A-15b]WIX85452.1 immunity 49 family protein [Amycolatopsis sp. DG1A-15b]
MSRHPVDEAVAEQDLKILGPGIKKLPMLIERSPQGGGVYRAMTRSLEELGFRTIGDPQAEWLDTWEATVRAMQAGAALFLVSSRTEGEVEFRYGEATLRREAVGPNMNANAVSWLDALWLAMICRERPRIDLLAAIPQDLLRASTIEYDEFVYSWVGALQTYWTRGEGLVEEILSAMAGTDPAGLRQLDADAVLQRYYPPIEMFYHLTQRDDAKFNKSLANALELHKRFWSTEDQRTSPFGYVALGPLAIACLARDAGVTIEVESEYLPANLLAGTWVGERST